MQIMAREDVAFPGVCGLVASMCVGSANPPPRKGKSAEKGIFSMRRFTLAVLAVAAFSAPAFAADCAKDYKEFWNTLDREAFAKLSGEQMAELARTTLRGYDSCTAGDERFSATDFYRKLDAEHYAKAEDIFRSGAFDPPGARK